MADRFPNPFDITTPAGAEGWERLYRYSSQFSDDRRDYEDAQFWFRDGVHWPEVVTPWDATLYEYAIASLSQYNTRHYVIPPALGVDFRILNGYTYLTPVGVTRRSRPGSRTSWSGPGTTSRTGTGSTTAGWSRSGPWSRR